MSSLDDDDIFDDEDFEDFSNMNEEMNAQDRLDGGSMGSMDGVVREFENFNNEGSDTLGDLVNATSEHAGKILSSMPTGVFDSFEDMVESYKNNGNFLTENQSLATQKFTFGMEYIRTMNMLNGNVNSQFNEDQRNIMGIADRMDSVNHLQNMLEMGAVVIVTAATFGLAGIPVLTTAGMAAVGGTSIGVKQYGVNPAMDMMQDHNMKEKQRLNDEDKQHIDDEDIRIHEEEELNRQMSEKSGVIGGFYNENDKYNIMPPGSHLPGATLDSFALSTSNKMNIPSVADDLDPEKDQLFTLAYADLKIHRLDQRKTQIELAELRNLTTQLRLTQQLNSGITSTLNTFTFSNSGDRGSILGMVSTVPMLGQYAYSSYSSTKRVDVETVMANISLVLDTAFVVAIAGTAIKGATAISEIGVRNTASKFTYNGIKNSVKTHLKDRSPWMNHSSGEMKSILEDLKNINSKIAQEYGTQFFKKANVFNDTKMFNAQNMKEISRFDALMDATERGVQNGLKSVGKVSGIGFGINVSTGKFEKDTLDFGKGVTESMNQIIFGSTHEGLANMASTVATRTPIVSGIFSQQTFAVFASTFGLRALNSNYVETQRQSVMSQMEQLNLEIEEQFLNDRVLLEQVMETFGDSSSIKEALATLDLDTLASTGSLNIGVATRHEFGNTMRRDFASVGEFTGEQIKKVEDVMRGDSIQNFGEQRELSREFARSMFVDDLEQQLIQEEYDNVRQMCGLYERDGQLFSAKENIAVTGDHLKNEIVHNLSMNHQNNAIHGVLSHLPGYDAIMELTGKSGVETRQLESIFKSDPSAILRSEEFSTNSLMKAGYINIPETDMYVNVREVANSVAEFDGSINAVKQAYDEAINSNVNNIFSNPQQLSAYNITTYSANDTVRSVMDMLNNRYNVDMAERIYEEELLEELLLRERENSELLTESDKGGKLTNDKEFRNGLGIVFDEDKYTFYRANDILKSAENAGIDGVYENGPYSEDELIEMANNHGAYKYNSEKLLLYEDHGANQYIETESGMSRSQFEGKFVNRHDTGSFSSIMLFMFATRDPTQVETKYVNNAATLSPNVHYSDVSDNLLKEIDVAAPTSLRSMVQSIMDADYTNEWSNVLFGGNMDTLDDTFISEDQYKQNVDIDFGNIKGEGGTFKTKEHQKYK